MGSKLRTYQVRKYPGGYHFRRKLLAQRDRVARRHCHQLNIMRDFYVPTTIGVSFSRILETIFPILPETLT